MVAAALDVIQKGLVERQLGAWLKLVVHSVQTVGLFTFTVALALGEGASSGTGRLTYKVHLLT